jgi:hypothetical protein
LIYDEMGGGCCFLREEKREEEEEMEEREGKVTGYNFNITGGFFNRN